MYTRHRHIHVIHWGICEEAEQHHCHAGVGLSQLYTILKGAADWHVHKMANRKERNASLRLAWYEDVSLYGITYYLANNLSIIAMLADHIAVSLNLPPSRSLLRLD